MAGVDVILGVIPLLVEVTEYSHTVYQQFKRWRKIASELEEFQEKEFCYQCVFQKDFSLLLRSVTTTAEFDWIMERDVTELENPQLERKLISYFDDQYTCCGMVVKKIKRSWIFSTLRVNDSRMPLRYQILKVFHSSIPFFLCSAAHHPHDVGPG
jgi:hypothetical protein